eukprot:scaffold243842_cov31-Tisochrysis_lutea.AAC.1
MHHIYIWGGIEAASWLVGWLSKCNRMMASRLMPNALKNDLRHKAQQTTRGCDLKFRCFLGKYRACRRPQCQCAVVAMFQYMLHAHAQLLLLKSRLKPQTTNLSNISFMGHAWGSPSCPS